MPVALRVLGQSHEITIKMRKNYAQFLYTDDSATLDDLREAVGILEEIDSTARRVYGGSHPITAGHSGDGRVPANRASFPPRSEWYICDG